MCPSEAAGPDGAGDPGLEAARAGAILTIDLGALAENYRRAKVVVADRGAVVGVILGDRRAAPEQGRDHRREGDRRRQGPG